jgi:valyl-tRNA synthetase
VLACRLQHVSPTFRDYVTEQLQLYKNTTKPIDSSTVAATAATDAASNRRTALMSRLALEGSNSMNRSNGDMTATATSPYKLAQQLADSSSQYKQSEVVSSFSGSSSNLTAAAVAAHTAATTNSATSATTGISEPSQLSDIKSRLQRYQKPLAHIDGNTTAAAAGVASQHQATAAPAAAPKQQQQQQAQVASTAATLKERLARLTKAKTVL